MKTEPEIESTSRPGRVAGSASGLVNTGIDNGKGLCVLGLSVVGNDQIGTASQKGAKKMAAREGITLRVLIEEVLASEALEACAAARPSYEPLIFSKGTGVSPEFATGGWENIRDAPLRGPGR